MPKQRNLTIDRFRSITIIMMVIVNDLADVEGIPAILKHAPPEAGMTIADFVSRFFMFAIAATYILSFQKRAKVSRWDAYFHFIGRYLAIMGIGALFGTFEATWEHKEVWGTLQSIGLAGLVTLLVIARPTVVRAVVSVLMLFGYQLCHSYFGGVFTGEMGMLLRSLTLAAMLMLSTAMMDLYRKGLKPFLIGTGVLAAAALGPLFFVEISKEHNMISFELVATLACCVCYLAIDLLKKWLPKTPGLISWWGENPMLLYILHLILIGSVRVLDPRALWVAISVDFMILTVLSLIAWALHCKNLQIFF